MAWDGELLHIHIAPAGGNAMQPLRTARLVAGQGVEGDRYFLGTGTYSKQPAMREITLIEQEVLDALARNDPPLQAAPIVLAPHEHRRNLTVRGVPLGQLVNTRFRIGDDVVLRGGRINFPCKYLERMTGRPVYMALYNRGGLNCAIEVGGTIRPGDRIVPV